ncbi:transcription factor TFIIIB subunit brf1, partial [Kappamyces sp. JEL0680]
PNLIEKAKRVFDIALTAKYTKGRKSNCVVAACCYITCRMEKTSHMMIDFADAFSTNVYQIGAIFLQLRVMFLEKSGLGLMPLVDPGLYMARFADKLDFGPDTARVVANANRVAQRMDRDWIVRGRRPAGICAAALYIASRMNGYKRTIREIVLVVKICEGTLRKRLKEFESTESGQLSKTTFESINLDESANPPSFAPKRKHPTLSHDDKGAMDQDDVDGDEVVDSMLDEVAGIVERETRLHPIAANEDTLSDLDDDPEVMNSIAMDEEETDFKRELWMAENHDWVAKQQANAGQVKAPKRIEQRKVSGAVLMLQRHKRDTSEFKAGTAIEATRKMIESKPAMSKKINYDVLNDL